MLLTQEEIDALEDCINTRSDEGFETDIARQALEKINAAQQGVQPTLLRCDFTDCKEEVRHIMCSRHYDESQSG